MYCSWDPSDDENEEALDKDDEAEEADSKEFLLSCKNVGLTYSQCPLELKEVTTGLKELAKQKNLGLTKIIVGQEEHDTNGGRHFHAYLHFAKKFITRNVRYFDINVHEDNKLVAYYHPNIKRFPKDTRSAVKKWIYYCMKGGKYTMEGFMPDLFLFKDAENFSRKMADHQAWMRAARNQGLRDPFPFNLPDGFQIVEPTMAYRKRHWLILAEPDKGKTWWARRTFAGARVFARNGGRTDTPYETGSYSGQKVIIWDDVIPKISEVVAVTNGASGYENQVFGRSRYSNNYWTMEQATVIIWLLNPSRLPDWAKPWHKDYYIFSTRFNVMALENGQWVDKENTLDMPDAVPGVWVNPG